MDRVSVLAGQRILLGVSGGISAYKSVELARLLIKRGAVVKVVMTEAATRFVGPLTFQAVSGNPVRTTLFDESHEAAMGHIELARWADQLVVAPASADFLARVAHGLANDLLTTLVLASPAPVSLAPAMNQQMWGNPATAANVTLLRERGLRILGPAVGEQACGDTGLGRMLEPADILGHLEGASMVGCLAGRKVMITAGPTREAIDPVRFIANRSSGKMGFALAASFVRAGAEVQLISGPVDLETPAGVQRLDVETAREMFDMVMSLVQQMDIFVACAAVADYRPEHAASAKIKKSDERLSLDLIRNPDILAAVAALEEAPFTLGFAAETGSLLREAQKKRETKAVDMIAANLVGEGKGFESDDNALQVLWNGGGKELPLQTKQQISGELVNLVAERFCA